ncbi:MAG: DNA translocase FtsK, partial [Lactobacillus sp.]|nr:DNA translocase FtsK [Lactobacillus sp.]
MPAKRKKRKIKKTYSKKKTAKKQNLEWSILGLVFILLAIFAFVRFGILGKQIANLIRLFFGDSYLLAASLLALFGLVNLIYNQPVRLSIKRIIGLSLTFIGILLIQSNLYYEHELVNSNFLNSFWHAMTAEFARAGVTESVGGG